MNRYAVLFVLSLLPAAPLCAGSASADLSVFQTDAPDPVAAGGELVYTLTVSNKGPNDAASVVLTDTLPAGTTFQSLASPAGWSCTTPAVGANGPVSCSIDPFPVGSSELTLAVLVAPGTPDGTMLANLAEVSTTTLDPSPGEESSTIFTTVASSPTPITFSKTASPDPVESGTDLTYTLTVGNSATGELALATVADPLPEGTTFVSLAAPAGWSCTTPAVGAAGTVSCSAAPFVPGDATFTLIVNVATSVPGGTVLGNLAQLTVNDSGRDTQFAATAATLVVAVQAVSEVPALDTVGLAVLVLLLALGGAVLLRRRSRAC